jgi:hypothetical protein
LLLLLCSAAADRFISTAVLISDYLSSLGPGKFVTK